MLRRCFRLVAGATALTLAAALSLLWASGAGAASSRPAPSTGALGSTTRTMTLAQAPAGLRAAVQRADPGAAQAQLTASDGAGGDELGTSVALSGFTAVVGAPKKNSNAGSAYVFTESGTGWTQQAELTAAAAASGDLFGSAVAISGTTVIVGAPGRNSSTGSAFVFTESGAGWTQQELTATDGAADDQFAFSVAVSGTTALVGAPQHDSTTGAAYVFTESGTSWNQQAELTASGGAKGDDFGYSVGLSGTTALVGAPFKDSFAGEAYVFSELGTSGTTWFQTELGASDRAGGDLFGSSVALTDTTAIVGAPGKNTITGAAYVFTGSRASWTQQTELTASGGAAGDQFGLAVAVSGTTAVVGAPFHSPAGTAYVFMPAGAGWTQQTELTPSGAAAGSELGLSVGLSGATALVGAPFENSEMGGASVFGQLWIQQGELGPSDGALGDAFGYSVAVFGTTALVGAPFKGVDTGSAYVFSESGTTWTLQDELTAADAEQGDAFGAAVALSGTTAIVGAPLKADHTGAVYVFTESGSGWNQQAELTAADATDDNLFGISVAASGSTALVGAEGNSGAAGAAYVFTQSGTTWNQQAELTASDGALDEHFGGSVALSGTTAVVGAPDKRSATGVGVGAAYVFTGSDTGWHQQAELTASDPGPGDGFGSSVAASGTVALVGAPLQNAATGAAYVFTGSQTGWSQQAKLTASDGAQSDDFGFSLSIAGGAAVVGAPGKNSAYVLSQSGGTWSQQSRLSASDGIGGDNFGWSVALSGATAVVGAPFKVTDTRAAYVFNTTQPTTTGLASSANPSQVGRTVTYTATVSPTPTGGTVDFTDSGSPACTSVPLAGPSATCTVTYGPGEAGTHNIVAAYSGSGLFPPSISPTLSQLVTQPTTTGLTSSGNPSQVGRTVTYTATVNPAPTGGTVTFTDNGSAVCKDAPLSGSTSACTVTYGSGGAGGAGGHNVVATYSGSGLLSPSASSVLSEVVTQVFCASLAGCNLRGLSLTDASLPEADLAGSNLAGVDFSGANLTDANLSGTNLTKANLQGADLAGADLAGSNLAGARLQDANLTGADLSGANLRLAVWGNTTCPDGTNSNSNGGTCIAHL